MNEKIKRLFQIGVINTIRINLHYFGLKGLIHHYIICSRKVKLLKLKGSVEIKNPRGGGVHIGFYMIGISDYKHERTIWQNSGKIVFEGKTRLGSGVRISNSGEMTFGDNITCTGRSTFVCKDKLSIGADSVISWDNLIMDTDFHSIYEDEKLTNKINNDREIIIGQHCWIGCRCLIKKGTILPNNTILAAGSNISGCIEEENCIIGDLGKILKRNIYWKE